MKNFLYLHIRKSGGTTVKNLLKPYYVETNRNFPKNFIQASTNEYNDVLNNHVVVLGEYHNKRMLFAKNFLFKEDWNELYKFTFVREPIERCNSMFFYLVRKNKPAFIKLLRKFKIKFDGKKFENNLQYAFSTFLNNVEASRNSGTIHKPFDIHFLTHTAKAFDDITDLDGQILVNDIFDIKNLNNDLKIIFNKLGILNYKIPQKAHLNKSNKEKFKLKQYHYEKIMELYKEDFEIYESLESKGI